MMYDDDDDDDARLIYPGLLRGVNGWPRDDRG